MERLWSPWRSQYIGTFKENEKKDSEVCFFCNAIKLNEVSMDTLIVHIGNTSFVIMNKYPYNNGHLLISPKKHTGNLDDLTTNEMNEIMQLQSSAVKVLENIYKPHGFNIGANLGRAAGAGVPGHLHYHVLPRWNGDTNFMPILAETKVLSQSLEDSFNQIAAGFKALRL
ncbi:MAG: HIT domain-containing protein [Candidatus Kapabacteria bacterium]|nr:HIT domain-containing protein [Ignavibacteriota bacterium]MCW5886198.1 HIT domain-containing protein [Candidatus Kapabacteria bacterium]